MAEPFCAEVSRARGDSLAGTATRAECFLLVEHPGPWGEHAVEENDLPESVRAWMESEVAELGRIVGKTRPLLIRNDGRSEGVACFLAVAQQSRRALYRFDARGARELPALALADGLAQGALERHRVTERLTLVCGNGRRDRCCARFGVATARELARSEPATTWLSTHQGGHRYAASGLWLPEGVAYGYLQPEEAPALLAARARGALHLPCFRGRTFHGVVEQAADVSLRAALRVDALDPWELASSADEGGGRWRVDFAGASGAFTVRLRRDAETALVSCSPPKEKRIDRFELLAIEPAATA